MISQAFVLAALAVCAFASLHEPIHHHAPQPYKFGYSVKDKHGEQHREESGDGGHAVRGSYGFTDARAAVHLISDAPYGHGGYAGAAGLGYAGVAAAPVGYAGLGGAGLGYAGAGLRYAGGYGGLGYGGNGLGILGGLGYARYGF
ncbi:cuticle protein 16.8 [Trichonephila clavipes]|nr:cuticle protein 16.8 [Trichonephila clavipes]